MAGKRTKAQPKRTKIHRPPLALLELDSRLRQETSRVGRLSSLWIAGRNDIDELRHRVDALEAWMEQFDKRRARRGAA